MIRKPARGLFVTGTDTDVGKTYIAAGIAQALRRAGRHVGVYKPAASGCVQQGSQRRVDDAQRLWHAAGKPLDLDQVCPQAFLAPLAPHLAARAEGREVDAERLVTGIEAWEQFDIVLVEGAGGLLSPIAEEVYVADLARAFGYPMVIVAKNAIGVINQVLQTVIVASTWRGGLPLAGIVLNDPVREADDPSRVSNEQELRSRCRAPLLAHVPWQGADALANIDWFAIAQARASVDDSSD